MEPAYQFGYVAPDFDSEGSRPLRPIDLGRPGRTGETEATDSKRCRAGCHRRRWTEGEETGEAACRLEKIAAREAGEPAAASNLTEIDRADQGSGIDLFDLNDNRTDCAKTAGRGVCFDRIRESEFVGPTPGSPKRIGRERLFVSIMFRKSELGRAESRVEGRNAGSPRLRSAEAGVISPTLRPGPEGRLRRSKATRRGGDLPPAGDPSPLPRELSAIRRVGLPGNLRFDQAGHRPEINNSLHCESAGRSPLLNRSNRRLFATYENPKIWV